VPSDWEAFNAIGAKNQATTADWKAALDITVSKKGVMTMVLHPHGWSDPAQIVELIEYAVATYGRRVKFLNFPEALARLEKNALAGHSLRSAEARVLDLDGDGFMDVLVGRTTRLWSAKDSRWVETPLPAALLHSRFGIVRAVTMLAAGGAWSFEHGKWIEAPALPIAFDDAMRLRDFDNDGRCELLAARAIYRWSESKARWEDAGYSLPDGAALDAALRFIDLNADGFDDILYSNADRFGIWLWSKKVEPHLGWTRGWSQLVRAGARTGAANEPPPISRGGAHPNNGAWFRDGHLVIQNEDTAALEGVVERRSFKELIAFDVPPPKSPEEALASMRARPGFIVELVAAEPLVVDPIAFEWDAEGRLWVVEMRDYPLGIDGKGKPGGVIKVLTDSDGDGRYDKATAFLEEVPFPTGIAMSGRGVIVAAAPDIFYAEDSDGDGRADKREVLFTGFGKGNQQHRVNGFEWGLDGWLYGANGESGGRIRSLQRDAGSVSIGGRDFRFRPTGEFETASGATQYGRRRDDWGNWFGNNNPTWLWHYTLPEEYLRRNPKLAVKSVRRVLANYENATRVFAASAPMQRPNQPESIGHVTSACSPAPYRDELFGVAFATSVFISEPVHNVVHREVLERDGASFVSRRAEDEKESEFLASTDNWFRPTMLKTGPDGALYVADMYRFVIEHPEWISPETQSRIDVRLGEDKGRIWRVRPSGSGTGFQPVSSTPGFQPGEHRRPGTGLEARATTDRLEARRTTQLVAALESPNGWQRDTTQRLLVERNDRTAIDPLRALAANATNPKVRLQALATLAQLDALTPESIITALRDPYFAVRVHALKGAELFAGKSEPLFAAVRELASDADPAVRMQLAFTLGAWPFKTVASLLTELAATEDELIKIAAQSSCPPDSELFAKLRSGEPLPKSLAPPVFPALADRAKVIASFAGVAQLNGIAMSGRAAFQNHCSMCHRLKGEGHEVGPDLGMVAGKPIDWLLTAIFDPNQTVEQRYRAQRIVLKSGGELVAIIATETANNITTKTLDGAEHAILRDDIREVIPLGRSLMPEGLESALKPQDIADLVSWLRAK
jgi:putative membrane-bound dehydrogenase-like protein